MSGGRFLALAGSGFILLLLTGVGLFFQREDNIAAFVAVALAQAAVHLAAIGLIWRSATSRRSLALILGIAAALRLVVLAAPPVLSSDIYRYVWDGRMIAAGINPYRYIPSDPQLAPLRDAAIFPRINRNTYAPTIYPPAAEAIFFAVTRLSETVTAMKAAMVGFEVVAMALLLQLLGSAGVPRSRIVIYAWHPLPLWEFAGSGHIDAAIVAFIALALWSASRVTPSISSYRRRPVSMAGVGPGWSLSSGRPKPGPGGRDDKMRGGWVTGVALAAATLVKFYPAVVLPALWRRGDWRMPIIFAAAVLLAYLPFLGVGWRVLGFLPGYLAEEGFAQGGSGFFLWSAAKAVLPLGGVSDLVYIVVAAALLAALAVYAAFSRIDATAGAALLAGAFMLLLSPHYPWYFAWLLVFACLVPAASLLWLTWASFLLYLVPVGSQLVRTQPRFLVESALYLPFLALAASDLWRRRRQEAIGEQRSVGEHHGG